MGIPLLIGWVQTSKRNDGLVGVLATPIAHHGPYDANCAYECDQYAESSSTCYRPCFHGIVTWEYRDLAKNGTHRFNETVLDRWLPGVNETMVLQELRQHYALGIHCGGYYFDSAPYTDFVWRKREYTTDGVFTVLFFVLATIGLVLMLYDWCCGS